jgi:Homeodomain-like domain
MARQRIELAPAEAAELSRRARATTVPVRDRQRAEIILLSAQGLTQLRIAEQIGTSRLSVNRWVGRFALHRLAGLSDRAGRGRKPWLPQVTVQQVLEQAVTPPPHLGRWSCRTMARAAGSRRPACSVCGRPVTSSGISRAPSNYRTTSALKRSSGTSSGGISTHRTRRWCCAATRNPNVRRWSAPNQVCHWGSGIFVQDP